MAGSGVLEAAITESRVSVVRYLLSNHREQDAEDVEIALATAEEFERGSIVDLLCNYKSRLR